MGGYKNIQPDEGVKFTSENQPANRGRKSTKFLTDLLIKNLQGKKEITIEGIDTVTGKKTTIKITMPTKETITQALLRQAAKGNINAIREVLDRVEGKAPQALDITSGGEKLQTTIIKTSDGTIVTL